MLIIQGRINRHRTTTPSVQHDQTTASGSPHYHKTYSPRTQNPPTPWQTSGIGSYGRGRGRIGKVASNPHRNRTLVLNNKIGIPTLATGELTPGSSLPPDNTLEPETADRSESPQLAKGWVTKRDRHMQLINSSIYDKEAQTRNKAIEETRKQKAARRDQREKQKIERHLKAITPHSGQGTAMLTLHEITINGLRFHVLDGGSKLARIRGGNSVPKMDTSIH